jgi:capsular exopolysaccharide synthesis family protein
LEEQLPRVIQFKDYLRIIQKRKWLAITFFVLLVMAGTIKSYMMEPVYQVTAKILIEREVPKITNIEEVLMIDMKWVDYHKTQYEILKSRTLAREVIKRLKLWESPEFEVTPSAIERIRGEIDDIKSRFMSQIKSFVKKVLGRKEKVQEGEPRKGNEEVPIGNDFITAAGMSQLIDAYLSRFSVSPLEDTRLVDISFEGHYPKLINQIINTHAKAYIEQNLQRKYEASQIAINWLGKGLKELREKGEQTENALQKFKEKEDIVALDNIMFSKNAEQDNIIIQKISQLNNNLTEAKMKRIELGAVYEQLKKVMNNPEEIESFPEIIQDPLIQSYKKEYSTLVANYLELSEKYGEKHPKMVSLKSEMEEKKARIKTEAGKLVKSMETQYLTAKDKEQRLEMALNEYKQEAMHLNRKSIEYGILKRDVDTNRELYDLIQKRLKETNITSGIAASNITVVDFGEVPLVPVRPNRQIYILLSAIVGLTIGIGLTFLFEYLDNTIKSPYDVDKYLRHMPFLGPIGSFSTLESELITVLNPESNFSESFRNIRTNLLLNCPDNPPRTFLITSPDRGEGKTLVSANLAVTMTQSGKHVLLIDANMRMPRLHSVFGVGNSPGLTDLIKGETLIETTIQPTEVEGLSIITAGKIPLDPLELLSSERTVTIVEKMKERFDFIIIDAPGVSVGPDSSVISRVADGVIILAQFGKTPRTLAQQTIDQLSNVQAKILGVVINNIDYKRGQYHFPYYKWLLKDDSRIDTYMVERITS